MIALRLLLDGEHPNHAALRHVALDTDMVAGQRVLDALRVNAPARLNGNIFGAVDFVSHRHAHDAGIGLLLPQDFAGLRIEGPEHPVVGASYEDEIARGRGHRPEQLRFGEVMRPGLLSGGRIPRLQFAIVIGARNNRQTDIFGLRPEPKLTRNQWHLLPGKAAAEILVGGNVGQSGFHAIRRRRAILTAPQGRAELNPLADRWFMLDVDDRPAGLGLDALPDIGFDEGPAAHIIYAVRLALEHPKDRIATGMDEALERAAFLLQVDQHGRIHLVPIP